MKRILLSATAVSLALSASSFAADLPSRKAPLIIPPPPPPLWTGFYAGLNAGGTWSASNNVNVLSSGLGPNPDFPGPSADFALVSGVGASGYFPSGSNGGFIGGGQVGYNYQAYTNFVFGLEADIQGVAASSNNNNALTVTPVPVDLFWPPGGFIATSLQTSRQLNYIGTVRGRLGFLATPTLLVYGTGGLAYGGVSSSASIFQFNNHTTFFPLTQFGPAYSSGNYSDTTVGWTAGAGVEWMFMPGWSAKVEYLYYDLGSVDYALSPLATFTGPSTPAPLTSILWAAAFPQVHTHFNGNIVRAGVNYHFNWGAPAPVLAKY
jgi:outer membrane immunogenic protein